MARLTDYARVSARQVMRKRVRLLLTVLGIAIGVAAVVGIVSLGEGIRYQSVEMIQEQSDLTLLEVTADIREGAIIPLTESKVQAIVEIPHVEAYAPVIRDAYATRGQSYLGVVGIRTNDLDRVFEPALQSGELYHSGTMEAVLGHDLAEKLRRYEGIRFGDNFTALIREYSESGNPEDREVVFVHYGVLQERGDSLDNLMFTDLETARSLTERVDRYDAVFVRVESPDQVFPVVEEIRGLGLNANGAFEQIESVNRLMDVVVLILAFFAGVSLIVGALMIMNTMITSVFERTREIGITMALGASQGDVVRLILFECFYIGIIGGIFGDLLGIGFASLINVAGKPFIIAQMGDAFAGFASSDITLVTPEILVTGIVIAIILSLVSGIYPAVKAAHLNPVEAIRTGR